jgi:hypothetical protein
LINKKRLTLICIGKLYQKRIVRLTIKKVLPRVFQEGDLILNKVFQIPGEDQRKYTLSYEGIYIVKKTFLIGALILSNVEGMEL